MVAKRSGVKQFSYSRCSSKESLKSRLEQIRQQVEEKERRPLSWSPLIAKKVACES
jgi:hypothetical protein